MKLYYKDICLLFSHRLTSYASKKYNRNKNDLLKRTSMDFFQTYVLINFFIPIRRAEAITSENFVPAKRDPINTIEGSRFAGMKLFTCNRKI